ncbi:MAG: radical SAM protein [Candidatus Omnitrophica bacterium]|nr:radical SAM protein [Candidatus Omnitrophota bacterium]
MSQSKDKIDMNKNILKISFLILLSRLVGRCPIRVMHFCTFRCNLHCKYCGIWKTPKREMTTQQIKKAMKEFAGAGTIFWTFTGGEPLLRKDIGELVNYAKSLFPIVTLTTNALLLKERIEEIKNVNYFTISIDGPKEITDFNRGKGTFDKTLEGIKIARDYGKDVVINAVISKANVKNNFYGIRKLIDIASNFGCKLNFSTLYVDQFNNSNKGIKDTLLTNEERIRALEFIRKMKNEKFNFIMFSNPCIENLKYFKKWKKCYAGKLFCDLFPDGTVVPCLFRETQGIDGMKCGFVKAFNMLPSNENCSCGSTCYTELNCIFSLKFRSVIENLLKYLSFVR